MRVSACSWTTVRRVVPPRPEGAVFALLFALALSASAAAQQPGACPSGLAAGLLPEGAVAISSEDLSADTDEHPIVIASDTVGCSPDESDASCEARAREALANAAAQAGTGVTILSNVMRLPASISATFERNGTIETLHFDDTESVFAYIAQVTADPAQSIVVESIDAEGSGARVVDVSAVQWQTAVGTPPGLRLRFRDAGRSVTEVEDSVADAAMIWGVDVQSVERVAGGAGQYVVEVRCP